MDTFKTFEIFKKNLVEIVQNGQIKAEKHF